jgi:hypothetical protein
MDPTTRRIVNQAFSQGRSMKDYPAGTGTEGDYEDQPGLDGTKLWFRCYERTNDGKTEKYYKFHHVEYNGVNYDNPPANSDITDTNDESNRGPAIDAALKARKKAAQEAAKKASRSAEQNAAYAADVATINQALALQSEAKEDVLSSKIPADFKKAAKKAEKAQAYIDDYNEDIAAIKAARSIQREAKEDVLAKGQKLKDINAKKADKLAEEARAIIAKNDKATTTPGNGQPNEQTDNSNNSDTSNDQQRRRAGGGDNSQQDSNENGGGVGRDAKKAENNKKLSHKRNSGGLGFAPDPNGDNLLARFAKVYGEKAPDELRKAITAYNTANAGTSQIKETYQIGQYGYSVQIVDKNGAVITAETDEIKNKLRRYISASDAMNEQYANDKNPARSALENTKLALNNTEAGGNIRGMTRRIAFAYTEGDTTKAADLITSAATKHPNKIRINNPGQAGSYIQVKLENGDWTSDADTVAKVLASNVKVNGEKPIAYNQQSRQQQAVISGANGIAVMNRLNLAMNTTGTDRLQTALDQLEKSKKGDQVRVHGTLGQPGFWVEVKVGDKWVNGTNAVLNKLKPFAGSRAETPPPTPPTATPPPAASSAGTTDGTDTTDSANTTNDGADSGSSGSDGAGSGDSSSSSDSTDSTSSSDNTSTTDDTTGGAGTDGTNSDSTDTTTQTDTKAKGAVAGELKNSDVSGSTSGASAKEVDISAAAQKSQAILAADLNKDGVVTSKEDTVLNAADRNQDGTVGTKELNSFVATADVNKDGTVARTESKAFKTIDSNDDHDLSKKELKAFESVAGKDGEISRKEAKEALKAQIDNKQDQREHDLAAEYLKRTSKQSGGSQDVGDQAAALVNAQQNKPKKQDNDGPGKKKKNK